MNIEGKRPMKINFPYGQYLKQLFSADTYVRFINPFSFWRRYRIEHLKTCKDLDTVQYLESCYQKEWRSTSLSCSKSNKNKLDVSNNRLLKQGESNTIYVSQPRIKLKYRGVSYYTQNALRMNIKIVESDPNVVKPNNIEQSSNFCNINSPEIFGSS